MGNHSPDGFEAILRPAGFPPVRIEAGPKGIRRVEFLNGRFRGIPRGWQLRNPLLRRAVDLLDRYFKGRPVDFGSLSVDLSDVGPFQRVVYRVLRTIPYGEVRTYGWIASRIGKPRASRAVGRCMGVNPLPILFPCHRVVAALAFSRGHPGRIETWQVRASLLTPVNGLGGFSCGLDIKRRLLELEGSDPTTRDRPGGPRIRSAAIARGVSGGGVTFP